jgi:branched-chain amino acid transport system substrate-binding protein
VRAFQSRYGADRATSADAEAAHMTVRLLAASLLAAGSEEIGAVRRAAFACRLAAPQGDVWIEPENNHAWLTPRIGRATTAGMFELLWQAPRPCRPDPYLASLAPRGRRVGAAHLRLVSGA